MRLAALADRRAVDRITMGTGLTMSFAHPRAEFALVEDDWILAGVHVYP